MRSFLLLVLIFIFVNASLIDDFNNKKYSKICIFKNIEKYKKDEKILSLIGVACVRSDKLFLLPSVINRLKHTKEGINNAIYFLTIYSQKKLLYAYFFYNFNIKTFSFPLTDYFISIIFDSIKNDNFIKKGNIFVVKWKNKKFEIYKIDDKLIIDEYEKNKFIKRHWFR